MKTNIGILFSVLALLSLFACEDYVSNVEPYNDRLVSEALNTERNVPALIVGVQSSSLDGRRFVHGRRRSV